MIDTTRIIITGSREYDDEERMAEILRFIYDAYGLAGTIIVHGAAPGADTLAATLWEDMGGETEAHPADWRSYGSAAGPMRNQRMVDLGANACIAFPIGDSNGTHDCINRAEKARIPVMIIPEDK